jgi:hypothetical protein
VSGREYLIDASAYWRIDRGAVLAAAWRDHLERGLVWICPPTEMEICRRASKDLDPEVVRQVSMVEEPAADEAWEQGFRDWIRLNERYLDGRIVNAAPGDRVLGWYRAVYSQNGAMPGSLLAELALEAGRRVLPRALEKCEV